MRVLPLMPMELALFKKHITAATNPLPGSIPSRITYKLSVKKKFEGMRLIDFLLKAVPRSTSQIWLEKIAENNLKINGVTAKPDQQVKAGEIIVHLSNPKTEPPVNVAIQLVYEDEELIVLNKPSPLPVHASGRFVRNTLIYILEQASITNCDLTFSNIPEKLNKLISLSGVDGFLPIE